MIEYRELTTMAELEEVVDLEIVVWGIDPRDAVPADVMRPFVLNGGITIGAFDNGRLVGMSMGYPARRGSKWLLWSHMAGVHPEYQSSGIGFQLKQEQRAWALKNGYKTIGWTFDPLRRGNAHFNLHRLGAECSVYHENFYGVMSGHINAGLPSDRAEVTWRLNDRHVKELSKSTAQHYRIKPDNQHPFILSSDQQGLPCVDVPHKLPAYSAVQIPYDLDLLKKTDPEAAFAWRIALRQILQSVFEQGAALTDFHVDRGNQRCWYILEAPEAWYLYVLECSDSTLYTGITPNLAHRISTHNSGKGAAYTVSRRPVRLIGAWLFSGKSAALKAELAFKRLTRQQKLSLIAAQGAFLGELFHLPD